jgi:hypothetical protein
MINKNIIKKLIAEGRTEEVIDKLNAVNFKDKEIERQVIAVSARYKKLEKEKHGNLNDTSSLNIELNKINQTLLHILESNNEINNIKNRINWRLAGVFLIGLFGLAASIAGFSEYTLKGFFSKEKTEQTSTEKKYDENSTLNSNSTKEVPEKVEVPKPNVSPKERSDAKGTSDKAPLINNSGGTISKSPIITGEKADVKIEYNNN